MFSYTDDAIVTGSPTGRHLSTVIRRPAAIGPLDWNEHAEQVCKVLNELDGKAKAHSLSLHMQISGRAYRYVPAELRSLHSGPSLAELIDQGYLRPPSFYTGSASARIAELEKHVSSLETECLSTRERLKETEKQLDDATTKLATAQMLLEKPIEIDKQTAHQIYYASIGATVPFNNRTFKRVE